MAPPLMLIGAGISAAGSLMAGQAAMAAGEYSQSIAERNATILGSKADQSIALGEHNVRKFDKAFATQQAATQAAYIAAGVKMSGTPMEIMEYNIAEAELEKMNIMYDLETIVNTKARTRSTRSLKERIMKNESRVKSARKSNRRNKNFDVDDLDLTI